MLILVFLSGLLLSLYHAFTNRPKTEIEKKLMVFFAVILNGFSGIWAGTHYLQTSVGWLTVFPVLNIANGLVLIIMLRAGAIDHSNIDDDNVSLGQVAVAAVTVVLVFAVCRCILNLVWAEMLSICVVYATNLNRPVKTLLAWITSKQKEL